MQYKVLCDNMVEVVEALIRACHWHTLSPPLKAKMFALDQKQPTHALRQFFKTRSLLCKKNSDGLVLVWFSLSHNNTVA